MPLGFLLRGDGIGMRLVCNTKLVALVVLASRSGGCTLVDTVWAEVENKQPYAVCSERRETALNLILFPLAEPYAAARRKPRQCMHPAQQKLPNLARSEHCATVFQPRSHSSMMKRLLLVVLLLIGWQGDLLGLLSLWG